MFKLFLLLSMFADRQERGFEVKYNTEILYIDSLVYNRKDITYFCNNGNKDYFFTFKDVNLILADSVIFDNELFCKTLIKKK
jgi:hypothetical protein